MTLHSPIDALPSVPAANGAARASFLQAATAELLRLRLVFILAAAYCVAAMCLAFALAGTPKFTPLSYAPVWLRGGLSFGFLWLMALTLPGVLRERPDRPLSVLGSRLAEYLTPPLVAGVALIATQVIVMGTFTSVKNMLPLIAGYTWDGYWAHVDKIIHFGTDPWRFFEPLLSRPWTLQAVESFYFTGWMLALGIVPAIVAFSPRLAHIRVRFFLTYILCWILLGNVLAGIFMSAGPVYFGDVTGDAARFGPLVDHLAANSGSFLSAYDIQRALWYVHAHGVASLGSGISAFPSLHIAMATLWVLAGFSAGRKFGIAALVFLALIESCAVALGWHYAVDGYASMALAFLIWLAVGWSLRRFAPEAGAAQT